MARKIISTSLLGITLLLAAVKSETCHAQSFKAILDTTSFRIGEQVTLKLDVTVPEGTRVEWPVLPDTLAESLEVTNRSKIDSSATSHPGYIQYTQSIRITSFDTGYHSIPPFAFRYALTGVESKTGLTDSLFLRVTSVAVDTTAAIREIKGQMAAPLTLQEVAPFIGAGLVVAIISALIWYYFWRKRLNKPLFPILRKPRLPAWQIAINSLDTLEQDRLLQQGKIKEYYSRISDILRAYLEDQHKIGALEMVTSEIIEAWLDSGLNFQTDTYLRQVLQLSDLVKFAKEKPVQQDHEDTLANARAFINQTKPAESGSEISDSNPGTNRN